jgi:2,3-bisphosphoglycerate-independent phosphoglycerate mutase
MRQVKKTILMIMDGWGIGDKSDSDLINSANTPNYDRYLQEYPNSILMASGENVGLPEGQMGNSEVGHLNIGAGRVIYQDLVKINKAIENGSFYNNTVLKEAFDYAVKNNKSVHLLGLVSNGGVHSMHTHLYELCKMSHNVRHNKTYIHILTDGRDTDPKSGLNSVKELYDVSLETGVEIASLVGRYYTMDRDKRWDRVKLGYDLMVHGKGKKTNNIIESIQKSYSEGITDEFILPHVVVDGNNNPIAKIKEDDVVICFNFRTDRLRQITKVLTQENMPEYDMETINLHYYTMTRYDESFRDINVVFDKDNLKNTIGEVLASKKIKQLRIAETEKYAHVTFFFSGGREDVFDYEERELVPSPKIATYDLKPEMSAYEVKDKLTAILETKKFEFICVNFANCDMVGHTGVPKAIVKAVETVDDCVGEVVSKAIENDYQIMIIADHGNADFAKNPDSSPNTAHSLNPVPCIIIGSDYKTIKDGRLADVAPSLLKMMALEKPEEMAGEVLVS